MCNSFEKHECTEFCDNRSIIVCKDKKSPCEYRINNISKFKFCKLKIDDCLITTNDKKCDYLIINCDDNYKDAFFIELKGSKLYQSPLKINIFEFSKSI